MAPRHRAPGAAATPHKARHAKPAPPAAKKPAPAAPAAKKAPAKKAAGGTAKKATAKKAAVKAASVTPMGRAARTVSRTGLSSKGVSHSKTAVRRDAEGNTHSITTTGGISLATPAKKALVAEYVACMLLTLASPLAGKGQGVYGLMKRGGAVSVLFLILGLSTATGGRMARAAAGFGGLVTLALLLQDVGVLDGVVGAITSAGEGTAYAGSGTSSAGGSPGGIAGGTPGTGGPWNGEPVPPLLLGESYGGVGQSTGQVFYA